jgi:hypothetical protein
MTTSKVQASNIKISNWGEVKQRLYYGEKEIVNASKSVQAGANATVLEYTTKDGRAKKFYFKDEVVVLDREAMKLRDQAIRDLHNRFMRHEISVDAYTTALKELEA